MPRWIGVDYGEKRIGIAVSDPDGWLASPHGVLDVAHAEEAVQKVADLCRTLGVAGVVVGLPLNMDGSKGPAAQKAEAFARALSKAAAIPVRLWDERLSSKSAHDLLLQAGMRNEKRRGLVDKIAAQMVLQSFLDAGAGEART